MQTDFAAALLDPARPSPPGLVAWNGSDPAARLAVYRNNVVSSLVEALADNCPVVRELVGEAFFDAMAAVFVRQAPPRSPILAHYGEGFADFIAAFEPARTVPYLADIARLETARMRSLHAADAAALSAADARSALADPDRVGDLRLHLHPSVILLRSPHAMVSIWAAHQGDDAAAELATLEVEAAEDALVLRDGLDVIVLRLPSGSAEFLGEVLAGGALGRATAAALQAEPCFDPGQLLALLLHHGALTSIDLPGRPIA